MDNIDENYCTICRINHCSGKKHKYSKKHKNKLENILKQFGQHVSYANINKPMAAPCSY